MIYQINTIEPHIVVIEENAKRDDYLESILDIYGKYAHGQFECDGKKFKAILYKRREYRETIEMTEEIYGQIVEKKTEIKMKIIFEYHFKEIGKE